MKCFINARIYDFQHYIENGYVLFDEKIISVGAMKDLPSLDVELIDLNHQLLLPGLVSGHTHLYSAFARGLDIPFDPRDFQEILEQLWWKLDRNLDLDDVYFSALAIAKENLLNGVTTLIDHHASGEVRGSLQKIKKAVVEDAHLRGVFAFETSDRFNVDSCIQENNQFVNDWDSYTSSLFGLHASLSLSDETLHRVKNESSLPLHVHCAESILDQVDSIKKYGKRIVERFHDLGLLRKDSLFVHCLYLSDEELKLLAKHEITVAVNVTSNMNNAVGLPNIKKMLDKNIPVIIGNDGLSSSVTNEYLNIYYTSHYLGDSSTAFSLDDINQLIRNTYAYASKRLQTNLGQIKEGFVSDFLVVPYDEITPLNSSNIFGHVFFGLFSSFKPKQVYTRGNLEVDQYQLTNQYLLDCNEKIVSVAQKVHQKVKEDNQ